MRKIVRPAAITILCMGVLSHCVIKRDTTASAATSAALAKKIAQGLAGGPIAPGSAQVAGPAQAGQPTCSSTISFSSGAATTCTTDTFEFYMLSNNGAITGYERFKNYEIADNSATYKLNGQINVGGTIISTYPADFSSITMIADMTFNGTLAISGSDSFSVTYKGYKIKTTSVYSTQSFSINYAQTCSGILTVESIDYTIQADCSVK